MRARRDEWIRAGVFEQLHHLALEAYDQAAGLDLHNLVVDGCIVKAPCEGENTGRNPVDQIADDRILSSRPKSPGR